MKQIIPLHSMRWACLARNLGAFLLSARPFQLKDNRRFCERYYARGRLDPKSFVL